MAHDPSRREVVTGVASLTLAAAAGDAAPSGIQYRTLGRTGEKVTCLGLGGAHIGKPELSSEESLRLIRKALDRGLTFLDNSWDYNNGESEIRMGKALRDGYRQKAFLMTKFDGRTHEEAARQIDESLKRLQTDHVDLLQFHEVIRFDDPDRFFAPGGAAEALVAARKAGKTRYIGFTGHKDPRIHLYMLEQAQANDFHFDTVQMPINVMDAHFRSFGKLVVPEAQKQGLGILGMKSMGSGVILKSNSVTALECLQYALSQPTSVVITGIDSEAVLDQALQLATTFKPLTAAEITGILERTASAASKGEYELFKTSSHFDSTALHPQWLGSETPRVKELGKGS
ncbi:MAG TPA: aldo/keto reductase [Bryobacteraceae bacterium]|jgi:aryl-alcohol dehydrogenase-like predicted oxidoreductase